jgi:hypothetical protein
LESACDRDEGTIGVSTYGAKRDIDAVRHWPAAERQVDVFSVNAALEIRSCIATAATQAAWWDDDSELIPSRESQH